MLMYRVDFSFRGCGWRMFGWYTADCESQAVAQAEAVMARDRPSWAAQVEDRRAVPWVTL